MLTHCPICLRRLRTKSQSWRARPSRTLADWDHYPEDRAALLTVLSTYTPVVSFDDRLHDRQTQAQAVRLCGEERLEQMLTNIFCQSDPVVTDGNLDFPIASHRADVDARMRRRRRRIECVQGEIEHDLLKLNRIAGDGRQARIERQRDLRMAGASVVLENARRCSTHLVEINRLVWQLLLSYQRADAGDDVRGERIIGDDRAEDLCAQFPFLATKLSHVASHDPGADFGVVEDRGERLTKLV